MNLSPLETSWIEFRARHKPVAGETELIYQAIKTAFEAGHSAGIQYTCKQVAWDIEERSALPTSEP